MYNVRILLCRYGGEHHMEGCTVRHTDSTPSVLVWARYCTSWTLSPVTMTSQRYITNLLAAELLPLILTIPDAAFQRDNAHPKVVRKRNAHHVRRAHYVAGFPSPHLSPVEKVWGIIATRLACLAARPVRTGELKQSGTTFCRRPSRISFSRRPVVYSPSSLFVVSLQCIDFLVFLSTYKSVTIIIYDMIY